MTPCPNLQRKVGQPQRGTESQRHGCVQSRTHPLSETLAELNRGDGFARLSLRGLTEDEVSDYIRATANVEPSASLVERVFEETEGNPFFLSEVVNLMT